MIAILLWLCGDAGKMTFLKIFTVLAVSLSISTGDMISDLKAAVDVVKASDGFKSALKAGLALLNDPATLLQDAVALVDELNADTTLPEIDFDKYWWTNEHTKDENIYCTQTKFSTEMISLLKSRLETQVPLNPPLEGVYDSYGFNTNKLHHILHYWTHKYDFAARQDYLNSFPQFVTNIQGLNITFYRATPKHTNKTVVPIILLHGFPQLNLEYIPTLDLLTDVTTHHDFVFDVIVPSFPGYGYSESAVKPGLSTMQVGYMFKILMNRLGYKQYYIHGGDFGYNVGKYMATLWPKEVLGLHAVNPTSRTMKSFTKIIIGALKPTLIEKPEYVNRTYPLISNKIRGLLVEGAFIHEQATKPDNLAAMRDSPAGLAQYLLYLFTFKTNSTAVSADFDVTEHICIDKILDVLTVHWDSKSFVNACRLYAESFAFFQSPELSVVLTYPIKTPFAAQKFLYNDYYVPDSALLDVYPNMLRSKYYDFGGQFAAMENPAVLTKDIFESVEAFMKFNECQ